MRGGTSNWQRTGSLSKQWVLTQASEGRKWGIILKCYCIFISFHKICYKNLTRVVLTLHVFLTGEGSGYKNCVYLVYDGIHYDPLAVQSSDSSADPLQTVFPVNDDMRLAEALEIAAAAKQVRVEDSIVC